MPKIQKGNNTLFINLPARYCRLMGWEKGTELICYPHKTEKGALVIKRMEQAQKEHQ